MPHRGHRLGRPSRPSSHARSASWGRSWRHCRSRATDPRPRRARMHAAWPSVDTCRTAQRGTRLPDTDSATRHIRVETKPGARAGVALVTLERPEALNALSFALLAELADALEALDT